MWQYLGLPCFKRHEINKGVYLIMHGLLSSRQHCSTRVPFIFTVVDLKLRFELICNEDRKPLESQLVAMFVSKKFLGIRFVNRRQCQVVFLYVLLF